MTKISCKMQENSWEDILLKMSGIGAAGILGE
jgi:hypothetical protein